MPVLPHVCLKTIKNTFSSRGLRKYHRNIVFEVTTIFNIMYGDDMTDGNECRKMSVVWTPNRLYKFRPQWKC